MTVFAGLARVVPRHTAPLNNQNLEIKINDVAEHVFCYLTLYRA